jgi:hypothetical protein
MRTKVVVTVLVDHDGADYQEIAAGVVTTLEGETILRHPYNAVIDSAHVQYLEDVKSGSDGSR